MKRAQDVEGVDQLGVEPPEAPSLVGVDDAVAFVVQEPVIEIDDASQKLRRKDPDAAVIEQIDPTRLARLREHRIIPQMRVSVDDADLPDRMPPRLEHRVREPIADLDRRILESEDLLAFEPPERQEALCRQFGPHLRDANLLHTGQDIAIKRRILGLVLVIELLAQTLADLGRDLARVDHRAHAPVQREDEFELIEVRLHGGLHVRILELAGERRSIACGGAVDLTEGGRRGGLQLERAEAFPANLGRARSSSDASRTPPPWGRFALQLLQLGRVFGRDQIRHGRQELRDLHDRPLQAAERRCQGRSVRLRRAAAPEDPLPGQPGRHPAHIGADARIARRTGGKSVRFVV